MIIWIFCALSFLFYFIFLGSRNFFSETSMLEALYSSTSSLVFAHTELQGLVTLISPLYSCKKSPTKFLKSLYLTCFVSLNRLGSTLHTTKMVLFQFTFNLLIHPSLFLSLSILLSFSGDRATLTTFIVCRVVVISGYGQLYFRGWLSH